MYETNGREFWKMNNEESIKKIYADTCVWMRAVAVRVYG
jgi:hypothetical protein